MIKKEDWKSCLSNVVGSVTYCGYLELDSFDSNASYKLQINYGSKTSSKNTDEGLVKIVKSEREGNLSFYEGFSLEQSEGLGKNVNGLSLENLLSFINSSSGGDNWEKIPHFPIKQEI